MTCRMRKHPGGGGIQRDTAALQIKHASNWFDERLRHVSPLYIAVRQALRVMHAVKRWRNVLIGDAFHGMRLHTRCL